MLQAVQPKHHNGLSPEEVAASRRAYGSNALSRRPRRGFWQEFLSSFGDPIIKILLAALAVQIIFLFHKADWFETVGVAAAIFLATFVSTLSEYGSESAFEKLQEDAAQICCRVRRREGIVQVPLTDLVVGDLVLLQAGERVPCDGILAEGSLSVDQSALNGENREAYKTANDHFTGSWNFSAKNQLFRGTVVMDGEGTMHVLRVGDATFYGEMAKEMQEETRESPLKLRLRGLAKTISRMGYVCAALVAAADLFHAICLDNGMDPALMLQSLQDLPTLVGHLLHAGTLALTVVVVAVPEGLPMMITIVLSRNMMRMLKDRVLVRKLVGIETSGSLNILFTDKTGTLTRGKLSVGVVLGHDGVPVPPKTRLQELVMLSCLLNNQSVLSKGQVLGGNATDRALLAYAKAAKCEGCTVSDRLPFNSTNKYAAAAVHGKLCCTLWKGAPEKLLPRCTHAYTQSGERVPFSSVDALRHKLTQEAYRVVVLATSDAPIAQGPANLTFVALIGIRDEVRPEAKKTVSQIRSAGIQAVMITGDNRETAVAIARKAGILGETETAGVLTGQELARLGDEALRRRLPRLRVIARALPTDKSRLVRIAQQAGLVVGMTGDGINDAPALKKADVGFSLGSGTEVAKEAGDIVILDDNIASVAKAVLYGRTIFKSIRKFLIFQLTMNVSAVGISILGPFIGVETPITVMQMLWINIIMDTLAGIAFAGEPPLEQYMLQPPKKRDEPVMNKYMVNQILCVGLFTVVMCTLFLKGTLFRSLFRPDPEVFMTAFFCVFIFFSVFNSFNARTNRLNLFAYLWRNPLFTLVMLGVCATQVLLVYHGGSLFRTVPLTSQELWAVCKIAFWVIPVDLVRKLILRIKGVKGSL